MSTIKPNRPSLGHEIHIVCLCPKCNHELQVKEKLGMEALVFCDNKRCEFYSTKYWIDRVTGEVNS